jgi:DNA-binding HxlR family transcriptional regulator
VSEILSRIGDKWTVLVVELLGGGPTRFNELRRMIGGISQKMLTTTLRQLERDGMVTRTVYPTIPPRVD